MTQKSTFSRTVLCIGAVLLPVVSAVFLYLGMIGDYDLSIHHFSAGSVRLLLAVLCLLCAILLSVAAGWLCRAQKDGISAAGGAFLLFSGYVSAFMLFALLITRLQSIASPHTDASLLDILQLVGMACTAAYLFLSMSEKTAHGTVYTLLSFTAIVFSLLSVLQVYFDGSYPMNAELKTWQLMMFLAEALFFTAEARVALRRTIPGVYVALAGTCSALTIAWGLSRAMLFFYDPLGHDAPLITSLAQLTIGLYAAARMFAVSGAGTAEKEDAHV